MERDHEDSPAGAGPNELESNHRPLGSAFLKKMSPDEIAGTKASLFRRTREVGYEARRQMLSTDVNEKEPAVIVEPLESSLWFVDLPASFLGDPSRRERLLELADQVVRQANKAILEAQAMQGRNGDSPDGGDPQQSEVGETASEETSEP